MHIPRISSQGRILQPTRSLGFSPIVLFFGLLILIQGAWITSAELIRLHISADDGPLPASEAQKFRARLAASIGAVRGDLWAEDALVQSGFDVRPGVRPNALDPSNMVAARAAAINALSLAPLNSHMWLLLAEPMVRTESDGFGEISALQMAYLTGQQDSRLISSRLFIAVRSSALADKEIQDFVRKDVEFIFTKLPNSKEDLFAAYRAATVENRALLEEIITAADPAFLPAELERSGSSRQINERPK